MKGSMMPVIVPIVGIPMSLICGFIVYWNDVRKNGATIRQITVNLGPRRAQSFRRASIMFLIIMIVFLMWFVADLI